MNTSRKDMLVGLVTDHINKLDETDLYKILDLLRNTEEARLKNVLVNATKPELKSAIKRVVEKSFPINVALYNQGSLPTTDTCYTPIMKEAAKVPELKKIVEKINKLGLNTAHYGIIVVPRYETDDGWPVVDVLFGMVGKFDAVATVNWNNEQVEVQWREVGNELSRYSTISYFGAEVCNGLRTLAKENQVAKKQPTKR